MMLSILVQTGGLRNNFDWTIPGILIAVIVITGMCVVAWIVLQAMNVKIPQWVLHVLLVIAAVIVGVLAIKFLASMW